MRPRTAQAPNSTQIPNEWFDKWLKEVESNAENKVVQTVMRFTFGWHDYDARITLSQFQQITGLSRAAVVDGIKKAIEHGFIERETDGHGRVYRMRTRAAITAGLKTRAPESKESPLFQEESLTAPSKRRKKARKTGVEMPLPEEMRTLNAEMLKAAEKAKGLGINIEDQHELFIANAERHSLRYVSWAGAWRMWLAKAIEIKHDKDKRFPAPVVKQIQSRAPLHESLKTKGSAR